MHLAGYRSHLLDERRLSPLTAQHYLRDVAALIDLAGDMPLSELKIQHLRHFVAQLHGRGLGGKSLARMLSAWRSFFNYLVRDHGYVGNPASGIRPPKAP
ncbi:MAG TPA: site-specific integrase, partial [Burkholderiales bacterium]|nr:site-specific integrase [Burkholderiales bacterium]